jgi:hypothetical protein
LTTDEKQNLKKHLALLGAYFQQQLPDPVIVMYAEDLADLPYPDVRRAMEECRREPKRRTMPMPADIRDRLTPAVTDGALALEAAARIVAAISKFGYYNARDSQAYIGEIGWLVVEKMGGWESICTSLTNKQMGTFHAQCRELAKAQIELSRAGKLDLPPALPRPGMTALPAPKPGLQRISDLLPKKT